jgi:hypothetical protein
MLADSRLERAGRAGRLAERRAESMEAGRTRRAGLVVIGDEILSAKVPYHD